MTRIKERAARAKNDKIPALTSLRFFAAAAIVYGHCYANFFVTASGPWTLGVSFFFVLSGFILTYAYDNAPSNWTMRYYVGRFARIWPVHLVTLLAATFLIYSFEQPGGHVDLPILFENTLLLQAWMPTSASVFSYNWVAWSLSVEVTFYLLFPLIIRVKHVELVYIATLAMALLGVAIASRYPMVMPTDPHEPNPINFLLQNPISRLPELVIGVVAARWHARAPIKLPAVAATCAEIIALTAFAISAVILSSPEQFSLWRQLPSAFQIWLWQSSEMLVFAALVFVFAGSSGLVSRALAWPPLVLLGEISFCTYMVHQLVLRAFVIGGWTFSAYTLAIVIPTIYAASYLLWRYVERPCRTRIMSFYSQAQSLLMVTNSVNP